MRRSTTLSALALVFATLVQSTAGDAAAAPARSAAAVVRPAESFSFMRVLPFLEQADAHGDRNRGAHGTFVRLQGNFETPLHTHSAAYRGIVIRGVVTNPFEGEKNPPKMGPGSYWYVPANARHTTACLTAEPCLFYVYQDDKFDIVLAK